MGAGITAPSVVNAWFDRNKAMPMALLMSAGALGGFIYPVLAESIASQFGWRAGWLGYLILTGVGLLFFLAFIKENPADVGDVRDGRAWARTHPPAARQTKWRPVDDAPVPLKKAYRSPVFISLSFQALCQRGLLSGCVSYLALFAAQNGISSVAAAFCLSLFGIMGLIGRLAAGVSDRLPLPIHLLSGLCFMVTTVGTLLLAFSADADMFMVASGLIGFGVGFLNTLIPLSISAYFGRTDFALLFASISSVASTGSTLAPIGMLTVGRVLGNYGYGYMLLAALSGICVILTLFAPVYSPRQADSSGR